MRIAAPIKSARNDILFFVNYRFSVGNNLRVVPLFQRFNCIFCGTAHRFSPAGSVGASALPRCPPDTRTVPYNIILNLLSLRTASAVWQSVFFFWGLRIAAPIIHLIRQSRLTPVSPVGLVGASALPRCPPDTRTLKEKARLAMTIRYSFFHHSLHKNQHGRVPCRVDFMFQLLFL